jgi:hypothetical protein
MKGDVGPMDFLVIEHTCHEQQDRIHSDLFQPIPYMRFS